jgi:hypothetical protein
LPLASGALLKVASQQVEESRADPAVRAFIVDGGFEKLPTLKAASNAQEIAATDAKICNGLRPLKVWVLDIVFRHAFNLASREDSAQPGETTPFSIPHMIPVYESTKERTSEVEARTSKGAIRPTIPLVFCNIVPMLNVSTFASGSPMLNPATNRTAT